MVGSNLQISLVVLRRKHVDVGGLYDRPAVGPQVCNALLLVQGKDELGQLELQGRVQSYQLRSHQVSPSTCILLIYYLYITYILLIYYLYITYILLIYYLYITYILLIYYLYNHVYIISRFI